MQRLRRTAVVGAASLTLAGLLTLGAAVALSPQVPDAAVNPGALPPSSAGAPRTMSAAPADQVRALEQRLSRLPRDHRSWSALAVSLVEQARVSGNPVHYEQAGEAVRRAQRLAADDPDVLTARATLAAARHDFAGALRDADRVLAANPRSAAAWLLRSDALTELGRYAAARRAALLADDLEPGPASFARLSYQAELRGRLREATRLMRLARDLSTTSPPAYAFAAHHLGELARAAGDLWAAQRHYRSALRADPQHAGASAGLARLAVARGDRTEAERRYLEAVSRQPLPELLVELAEFYLATGRPALAEAQLGGAGAAIRLAEANGVRSDLETALLEADHGSATAALRAARAGWAARGTIHTADAMAWALHAAGRDRAALQFAREATALGTRDARLLYHRGVIEAAVGDAQQARHHLRAALRLDAGTAPLRAAEIGRLLAGLR